MKKTVFAAALALAITASGAALAEQGVAYGVYNQDGEHPDSLIRVTMDCDGELVTGVQIDEKLIPYTVSGAEGWAELDDETAAKLGDAVLEVNGKKYPASFELGSVVFTGAASEEGLVYTGDVNGETVDLMDYICTDEGGAWYYDSAVAKLLDAQGNEAAESEIGTKASIQHGVAFWPSEITFPGNIERIENYLTENGVNYTEDQIVKGEDGAWEVADVTTGATLAGTKNYLLIAQQAYEKAQAK